MCCQPPGGVRPGSGTVGPADRVSELVGSYLVALMTLGAEVDGDTPQAGLGSGIGGEGAVETRVREDVSHLIRRVADGERNAEFLRQIAMVV
jgi:hypothetical protein